MNIFKKLFTKRKKKQNKEECWYNNTHEDSFSISGKEPLEGVALSAPNSAYYTTTKQNTESSR